jgi:hypothetical protein
MACLRFATPNSINYFAYKGAVLRGAADELSLADWI